jgi:bacteriocin biosynthesis cyclodehydratase domain-containing protein
MNRPVLAPGLRVLRRSRDQLQVGLAPHRRVRLPDTEAVRRTLSRLVRGEAVPGDPETAAVLQALAPVLVDGAGLVAPGVAVGDVAALALQDPAGYPARLAARRAARVAVRGTLDVPGPEALLAAAGVELADDDPAGPRPPTAVLVLCSGEIDRGTLDPLVREAVPHLLVRLVEGTVTVGPFVEPGRTACLRCIDAHRSVDDPESGLLAARHALAAGDRHDGVADACDSALATLALAWAVRDLVTHAEHERPSTWSATVRLSATLTAVTQTEWLRHPACGCSWAHDEQTSSTMAG